MKEPAKELAKTAISWFGLVTFVVSYSAFVGYYAPPVVESAVSSKSVGVILPLLIVIGLYVPLVEYAMYWENRRQGGRE